MDYNFELEDNVIAAMLLEATQDYVLENVDYNYFENEACMNIFKIAKSLKRTNEGYIDEVVILNAFGKEILYNIQYKLEECKNIIVNVDNVHNYCKMLHEFYMVKLIKSANNMKDYERIKNIENGFLTEDRHSYDDTLNELCDDLDIKDNTLVKTGYTKLDERVNISGGKVIILGGSTGCGKSAFALNMVNNICKDGKSVLYVNLEMTQKELVNRLVCMNASLKSSPYEQHNYTDFHKTIYRNTANKLRDYRLFFADRYETTCSKIATRAKQLKNQGALDVIFIDYLGLIQERNGNNSYEKTTIISRNLKLLANELNIPIVCLVQLNRENKSRINKRPVLSDIRDSGAIEQDADVVMFVFREYLYNNECDEHDLELIIEKNRCGQNKELTHFRFMTDTQSIVETQ